MSVELMPLRGSHVWVANPEGDEGGYTQEALYETLQIVANQAGLDELTDILADTLNNSHLHGEIVTKRRAAGRYLFSIQENFMGEPERQPLGLLYAKTIEMDKQGINTRLRFGTWVNEAVLPTYVQVADVTDALTDFYLTPPEDPWKVSEFERSEGIVVARYTQLIDAVSNKMDTYGHVQDRKQIEHISGVFPNLLRTALLAKVDEFHHFG